MTRGGAEAVRDAIVVGAGLAGLRAARDLADAGRSVLVLEARDVVGGRGRTSSLGGRTIELGGSWFTPEHDEVRAELARYGQPVRDFPPVLHARWRTDGVLRHGLPVPWDEVGALERVLVQVVGDAARLAAGDVAVGDVSAAEYIAALAPTPAIADFLTGWWQLMGGAPPERGAVADALASVAAHGGLVGLVGCLAHGPALGWSALAEALAASPGVAVERSAPVTAIALDADGATCRTGDGRELRGRAVVLAVPLNCLDAIAVAPPLPERIAESIGANVGSALKVVMRVRGVPPHGIAVGVGDGLHWWYVDDEEDGLVRVTGFGWEVDGFDPARREDVERALAAFFPEATLVDHECHDWIADPASRGTWLTAPAGRSALVDPARFGPVGRLVLAGSDVAEEEAGWFEGALRSGAAAALHVLELLGG